MRYTVVGSQANHFRWDSVSSDIE